MTAQNQAIMKAEISVDNLRRNGGYLNAAQSRSFTRKMIETPTILRDARRINMTAPMMNTHKIGFGERFLQCADAKVCPDGYEPTTDTIGLQAFEYIGKIVIPYDAIEDNIEGGIIGNESDGSDTRGGIIDTLMAMIAQATARDLQFAALLSDASLAGVDNLLGCADGWLVRADSNVVDAQRQVFGRGIMRDALITMPDVHLQDPSRLRTYISSTNAIMYRDQLASRQTPQGDAANSGFAPVSSMGSRIIGVPSMPVSVGLVVDPTNLVYGIWRDIHIEVDKDICARCYMIVVTLRVAFGLECPDAVVKIVNLGDGTDCC